MTSRGWVLVPILLVGLSLSTLGPAAAHKPSDSYLSLTVTADRIEGRWDIALRDLEEAVGVDTNGDGSVTWGELRRRHGGIAAYALTRLAIAADGAACATRATDHLVERHSDGAYAVLRFVADCRPPIRSLDLSYDLLFDIDGLHRGLLKVETEEGTHTAVFAPERRSLRLTLADASAGTLMADFLREGVWHIWIGLDHVLFLVTLVLPAVLHRRSGSWQAVVSLRATLLHVVQVVTAFTVAHSLTLGLAVVGLLDLPARAVEAAIAASVVIVALNNLCPVVTRRLWLAAAGFGLLHGLGFASVLQDLGLPTEALWLALLSFNLGVELGQVAIVAVLVPLLFQLRQWWLYRPLVLQGGSLAIALIGVLWLGERALGLALPGL